VRATLPDAAAAPFAERRDRVSKMSLPRGRISSYCWAEQPSSSLHCCLPMGHAGLHYHPYRKRNW
jgi:hypothetical protein